MSLQLVGFPSKCVRFEKWPMDLSFQKKMKRKKKKFKRDTVGGTLRTIKTRFCSAKKKRGS